MLRALAPRTRILACLILAAAAAACSGSAVAHPEDAPPPPTPEQMLRTEVEGWRGTPYRDHGTTREGIGSAGFVNAVFTSTYGVDIPATHDQQIRTGKLVEREALLPGDLVFFEGRGFGPFRPRFVGIFLGDGEVALAHKDVGVAVVPLTGAPGGATFKTARRVPLTPVAGAPTFDAAKYGANRAALLRDIAVAWSGTLYRQAGTTFDGIGNREFVSAVYEAIHEAELDGMPGAWATMGDPIARDALEPGDIVIYEPPGFGQLLSQRHAGIYIGDGDFVHAVRGSAVTISQLDDDRWSKAFRTARRLDPETLARIRETRAEAARHGAPSVPAESPSVPSSPLVIPAAAAGDERRLREAVQPWHGTPYRIGGTTKSGVDCSAFVRAVYTDTYRVDLPRTAAEQEGLGAAIERRHLQTGDLVFFRTQGMGPLFRSRHVGVYLGNGEFAHASGKRGVTISRLDDYYWNKKYAAARRLSPST